MAASPSTTSPSATPMHNPKALLANQDDPVDLTFETVHETIGVDVFDTCQPTETSPDSAACRGYTLTFPEGKSPYGAYPFALHDACVLL